MHKRCAGLNIPVFSLRSQKSCGIGEFRDLILLIDWAKKAGLKVIQILPINDTTMQETDEDGYPYSILSAFALHPIYIHLQELAPELSKEIAAARAKLNRPKLQYGEVYRCKKKFLRAIFSLRGEKDLASKAFAQFFRKNKEHLMAYAAFCVLRDERGTSDFLQWGKEGKHSPLLVKKICERAEVLFYYFVQFHLDRQLKEVVAHAKKQGILFKGDFPMGMHPHSVEAWRFHDYFRWHKSMGAPPDFYNNLGQNWGFPPYDWEEIKNEKFYWLKVRLKWMESYFNLVRLDHVLGYFRLWEVPIEQVRGLMGTFYPAEPFTEEELKEAGLTDIDRLTKPYNVALPDGITTQKEAKEAGFEEYYPFIENVLFFKDPEREKAYHPRIDLKSTGSFKALDPKTQKIVLNLFSHYYLERQEDLWKKKGKEKLKVIQKSTKMGVCAEDIGVIPRCVAEVLHELNMLNLHIQRMPKSFEIEYESPKDFPKTCVCTPSNHDTATLREWWEEDKGSTTRYYHQILGHEGVPPDELTETLATEIVQTHLNSKALYAIFLLQDLFATSDILKFPDPERERINNPALPAYRWDWRMHLYLEELDLADSFTQKIQKMVKESKR